MNDSIERIACPRCGKPDYEVFDGGDGWLASRAVSHIECVVAGATDLNALRKLYESRGGYIATLEAENAELRRKWRAVMAGEKAACKWLAEVQRMVALEGRRRRGGSRV